MSGCLDPVFPAAHTNSERCLLRVTHTRRGEDQEEEVQDLSGRKERERNKMQRSSFHLCSCRWWGELRFNDTESCLQGRVGLHMSCRVVFCCSGYKGIFWLGRQHEGVERETEMKLWILCELIQFYLHLYNEMERCQVLLTVLFCHWDDATTSSSGSILRT